MILFILPATILLNYFKMTVRTKTTIAIIVTIPFWWEAFRFWRDDFTLVNPWFDLNYPLWKQWFIKFCGLHLADWCFVIAIFRLSRMQAPIRIVAWWLVAIKAFDTFLFFKNFNFSDDYVFVYHAATIIGMLIAFFKDEVVLYSQRKYYRIRRKYIRWKLRIDQWKRKKATKSVPHETTIVVFKNKTVDV